MNSHSSVMHMAHILRRNRPSDQWSVTLKNAWYFNNLRAALRNGLVCFTFLKLNNSIRDARGTTNQLLIPAEDRPKHNPESMPGYKPNHAIITFYDIDARGWRSFDIRRYIGIAKYYPLSKYPVKWKL